MYHSAHPCLQLRSIAIDNIMVHMCGIFDRFVAENCKRITSCGLADTEATVWNVSEMEKSSDPILEIDTYSNNWRKNIEIYQVNWSEWGVSTQKKSNVWYLYTNHNNSQVACCTVAPSPVSKEWFATSFVNDLDLLNLYSDLIKWNLWNAREFSPHYLRLCRRSITPHTVSLRKLQV